MRRRPRQGLRRCGVRHAAEALCGCWELTRLEFAAAVYPGLDGMLAMIGAAAGSRLEWLRLGAASLSTEPADEARAFWALPLHYPCLKHLEVELWPALATAAALDESLTAMLHTLGVVLPHCPALKEVSIGLVWDSGIPQHLPRSAAYCGELAAAFPGKRLKFDF